MGIINNIRDLLQNNNESQKVKGYPSADDSFSSDSGNPTYVSSFSPRLEALIQSALQDGVLTEQERAVIMRRAEKEGEDLEEVEMILNARLSQINKSVNNSSNDAATRENESHGFILPTIKQNGNNDGAIVEKSTVKESDVYQGKNSYGSRENAQADYSERGKDISPIDKYPSELKTIINMAISQYRNSKELEYEHKQTLLQAAKKFQNIDPYQLLVDAEAAKKQDYYEYMVDEICKELGYARIYKTIAVEKYIMEAKFKFPNDERVKNAVAIAEHILQARKEGRDK